MRSFSIRQAICPFSTVFLLFVANGCGAEQDYDAGECTDHETYEYAKDGECDDRRFIGTGMASVLDRADDGKDSIDCSALLDVGLIHRVSKEAGIAATHCSAIDFGDDASPFANDGECDDICFDGPGTASSISIDDLLHDADDCSAQCERGKIWLRMPDK